MNIYLLEMGSFRTAGIIGYVPRVNVISRVTSAPLSTHTSPPLPPKMAFAMLRLHFTTFQNR